MHAAVVVLGDLGRSPRMLNHAVALARDGATVSVVGHAGSEIRPDIRDQPRVVWRFLHTVSVPARADAPRILFFVTSAARVVRASVQLHRALRRLPRVDIFLVQNPPAIPTLVITWIASRLHGARLVIDWHNFGHSMLALRLGRQQLLVRLARWYEYRCARLASAHLCVSQAMRAALSREAGIDAVVCLDQPTDAFQPTARDDRSALLTRLSRSHGLPADLDASARGAVPGPAIVVTATSWTADEDLTLLLDAARAWDARWATSTDDGRGPALRLLITGRGPLRASFEAALANVRLRRVSLHTLWLEPDDYPRLLGAADLGVSLHRSASGVDLPMKIVDMLGAGLPVCALNYGTTLTEQLQDGVNGRFFRTAEELAALWQELFAGFPHECPALERLRRQVAQTPARRWEDEWRAHAKALLS